MCLGECQSHRLWGSYVKGGIISLLSTYSDRWWGKLSSVQISQLRSFLLSDQAQTLADIQAYLAGNLGVKYSISGLGDLCKRLKIKAKTGRPVNVRQKPGSVEDFNRIAEAKKFVRYVPIFQIMQYFHDELRAVTRTELSRKWAPMGHRPIAPVKIGYENTYLYLTICPFTGEGFATFLPKLDSTSFGWFVQKVEESIGQNGAARAVTFYCRWCKSS
jgi:transposase